MQKFKKDVSVRNVQDICSMLFLYVNCQKRCQRIHVCSRFLTADAYGKKPSDDIKGWSLTVQCCVQQKHVLVFRDFTFLPYWDFSFLISCLSCTKGWDVQLSWIQNQQRLQLLKSTPFMITSFGHDSVWRSSTTSLLSRWLTKWYETRSCKWIHTFDIWLQLLYECLLHFNVKWI